MRWRWYQKWDFFTLGCSYNVYKIMIITDKLYTIKAVSYQHCTSNLLCQDQDEHSALWSILIKDRANDTVGMMQLSIIPVFNPSADFIIININNTHKIIEASFFAPLAASRAPPPSHMISRFQLFFVLPRRELFDVHTRNTFKNKYTARFNGISKNSTEKLIKNESFNISHSTKNNGHFYEVIYLFYKDKVKI